MKYVNIPIDLIKGYKGSKDEKELLAFAIGMKLHFKSSCITDVTVAKVQRTFRTSFKKAKSLIETAKVCGLFVYYEKNNSLVARSFKSQEEKTSIGRTPFKYHSDYCRKITRNTYTLNQLVAILEETLLLCAVNAVDRDKFTQSKKSHCAAVSDITLRKLGNIAGISKSKAQRMMKGLHRKGIISKTTPHAVMVIPVVNPCTVAEWQERTGRKHFIYNPKDNSGWVVKPCQYSIMLRDATESFKHVIYDHQKRTEAINAKERYSDPFDNPVNAMWL